MGSPYCGIVTYLLGLWNAEMQLNEKGIILPYWY